MNLPLFLPRLVVPALALCVAQSALAGDYDRNDVQAREVGLFVGILPADQDLRPQGPCISDKAQTCKFVTLPLAATVRGTARRHVRNLYFGTEVIVGITAPAAPYNTGLVLGAGAKVGLETAEDGFKRLRGYGEFGVDILYAGTKVVDWLNFFVEGGMRYQVLTYERPHTHLYLAARGMSNFSHLGIGLTAGLGWTFD